MIGFIDMRAIYLILTSPSLYAGLYAEDKVHRFNNYNSMIINELFIFKR